MHYFFQQPQGNHLNSLDGIRALSIIFVIFFHAFFFLQYAFDDIQGFQQFNDSLPWYLAWVRRGDYGVDMFFVLSSFLIGYQLLDEQQKTNTVNIKKFYLKRFLRIYPVYIFALLIVIAHKGWNPNIMGNLLAYNNLVSLKDIVIPWSWSLSVEIQFYLIVALIIPLFKNLKQVIVLGCLLLALQISWMSYFYFSSELVNSQTILDLLLNKDEQGQLYYMEMLYVIPPARLASFVFGLAAAWLWLNQRQYLIGFFQTHAGKLTLFSAFAGLLLAINYNIYQPIADMSDNQAMIYSLNMVIGRLVFSLALTTVLLASLALSCQGHWLSRALEHRAFLPIARGSYSMYLFHIPMLMLAFFIVEGEGKITSASAASMVSIAVLGVLFSFLFSIFTFYAVERWFCYYRLQNWWPKTKKSSPLT